MKKRMSKLFAVAMVLVMVLSVAALTTSCGGTKTLEDYVNGDKEVSKQLNDAGEQFSNDAMKAEVIVKENTLTYAYTYTDTYTKEQTKKMVPLFEKALEGYTATYEGIRDNLEKESEIEGVVVKITYYNGDGSEIYTKTYEKK